MNSILLTSLAKQRQLRTANTTVMQKSCTDVDSKETNIKDGSNIILWIHSSDVLACILAFLDVPTLSKAEQVCVLFQSASTIIWRQTLEYVMTFVNLPKLKEDNSDASFFFTDCIRNPKKILQKYVQTCRHGRQQAWVVRDHFFDRDGDAMDEHQGFSRLPRLHTSVLLSKFVKKYAFVIQMHLLSTASRDDDYADISVDAEKKLSAGAVTPIWEGFWTPEYIYCENSKYVMLKWNMEIMCRDILQKKWSSLTDVLRNLKDTGEENKAIAPTLEQPEITICAIGRNGQPRLVFATGKVSYSGSSLLLSDRISEQHPMLTHHFGVVPRMTLTLETNSEVTSFQRMILRYQGLSR